MPNTRKRKYGDENSTFDQKRAKKDDTAKKVSNKQKKGIDDMPNEMLLEIFSYLDQKSTLNATLVNKKWNDLISSTEATMKNIQTIYINASHMMKGIPVFTRPYSKVEVGNLKFENDSFLLNRLRRIGDRIKTVVFDHTWFLGNAMTGLLICFPNVEDLHITHCEITNVPIRRKITLRELKYLHLDVYCWPLPFIETPKLTKFQCHTMLVEDQKLIINFLNKQTELEDLDLNCFYNLFQLTPVQLNPKFKLKKLTLNDLDDYDKNQMMNMLSTMTESLTSLELGYDMGQDVTKYALKNFVNLESLSVDCDSLPNTPGFYNDIKTSQTLKKVEISGDLERTITVLQLLDCHPKIEYLDIRALYNIPSTRYSFWSRLADFTKQVSVLKIHSMDADNIRCIKSNNLKDIKIYSLDHIDVLDWIEFCRNNPNLENFHVYGSDAFHNIDIAKTVLTEHLPKFKNFFLH